MPSFEIFEPETYLFNNKKDELLISKYISSFRRGILIDTQPLYFLLIGSYAHKINNPSMLSEEERVGYKGMLFLLNRIKEDIGDYFIFISPHIFTKVINELRKKINDPIDFKGIVDIILDNFTFIREEEIGKDEILRFDNFKNMYCGISETTISLIKNKKGNVGIISYSDKIPSVCGEDYLFVDFKVLIDTIKEHERREEII